MFLAIQYPSWLHPEIFPGVPFLNIIHWYGLMYVCAFAPAEDYRADGAVGCSVADVLRPFELTAKYCGADYRPPFAFHTVDSNAGYSEAARKTVEQSAADYLAWLETLQLA